MDDVLDSLRSVHVHRDIHRHVPIMVPVLLRSEDSSRAVAPIAGNEGFLNSIQEVCASSALQKGTGQLGSYKYSTYLFRIYL